MSRLNTLFPNDKFLKNISNMFGKIDSKNETEIKQEIEQIGYKEFYRYSKEKDIYIKQLQQENQQLKKANEILKENAIHNDKIVDDTNWKIKQYKSVLDEIREYFNPDKWDKKILIIDTVYNEINRILDM